MKTFIAFFVRRPLWANSVFLIILVGGMAAWNRIPRQEMPDFTFDVIQVTVAYPGASAREVDHSVTRVLERELKSVEGVYRIQSSSSMNVATISLELEPGSSADPAILSDIRDTVGRVTLPVEVVDDPDIRQFKSSRKAIIDIGLFFPDVEMLNSEQRRRLQSHALALENRLRSLPLIGSVRRHGFQKEEVRVSLRPERLYAYQIPIANIASAIASSDVRQPAGTLKNQEADRVSFNGELREQRDFDNLVIQGGFEGNFIRLRDLAVTRSGFEEVTEVFKINGREGIILNGVKTPGAGILEAVDSLRREVDLFRKGLDPEAGLEVILLDDESRDVRNRLNLIRDNGLIGFALILVAIFIFLNFKAGFWVAMGIPFTLALTLTVAHLLGFTINNITLAAVIIVMGMIVDDAIVVSENILRRQNEGLAPETAAIEGTGYVVAPVFASILTTCAAFVPLLFFEGRMSFFTAPIPAMVSLMLFASFVESVIVLPCHLGHELSPMTKTILSFGLYPLFLRIPIFNRSNPVYPPSEREEGGQVAGSRRWFRQWEKVYRRIIRFWLTRHFFPVVFFTSLVLIGGGLAVYKMKFTLFPREESDQVRITAEAPENFNRLQTALKARELEKIIEADLGTNVVGFRGRVGFTGHRSTTRENILNLRVEMVNVQERGTPLKEIIARWKKEINQLSGWKKISFRRGWFGADSGSPLEILIKENNNERRNQAGELLVELLKKQPAIYNVELDRPYTQKEMTVRPNRELARRLGVNISQLSQDLRTVVEGRVLYRFLDEEGEEVDVRLGVSVANRSSMESVLNIPVSNQSDYLVPMRNLVTVRPEKTPSEIQRFDTSRVLRLYADIRPDSRLTPLEAARLLETEVFPEVNRSFPAASFSFEGEVRNARESAGFFPLAVSGILFLIFLILALQFNSLVSPVLVMSTIVPTAATVALVFLAHGMTTYGYFAVIGIMGLSGVLVNDAIIMVKKLIDGLDDGTIDRASPNMAGQIGEVAATRLKAILLTTITTVAGLVPTAYGFAGYDAMLAQMMLAMAWGLFFGTQFILLLVPWLFFWTVRLVWKERVI